MSSKWTYEIGLGYEAILRDGVMVNKEQAVRALKNYESRIAELEEAQRWIPVSERLPEDLQSVVIITNDSMTGIVRYLELYGREGFGAWSEDVTHWMPLPQPPEVQE